MTGFAHLPVGTRIIASKLEHQSRHFRYAETMGRLGVSTITRARSGAGRRQRWKCRVFKWGVRRVAYLQVLILMTTTRMHTRSTSACGNKHGKSKGKRKLEQPAGIKTKHTHTHTYALNVPKLFSKRTRYGAISSKNKNTNFVNAVGMGLYIVRFFVHSNCGGSTDKN